MSKPGMTWNPAKFIVLGIGVFCWIVVITILTSCAEAESWDCGEPGPHSCQMEVNND